MCNDCNKREIGGNITFDNPSFGKANVRIIGCKLHTSRIIDFLNNYEKYHFSMKLAKAYHAALEMQKISNKADDLVEEANRQLIDAHSDMFGDVDASP